MVDDAFRLTLDTIFNTKYSENCYENGQYKSPFPIVNMSDSDNLFEFVCSLNKYQSTIDYKEKKFITWKK